jgi:hypothetical protein
VVAGGGGLLRAARRGGVVVETEIAWGVWGKWSASPGGFYGSRSGELFLLKGKKSRPRDRAAVVTCEPICQGDFGFGFVLQSSINCCWGRGPNREGDVKL